MLTAKPIRRTFGVEQEDIHRIEWVATSWRPDPITLALREVVLGRGSSNRPDTINILLDALPIPDADTFCRIIVKPADDMVLEKHWPEKWTVLSYKTDRSNLTKKTIIGSGWMEDNEILVCLDAIPTPNQNIECWISLKPKIERQTYGEINNR